MPLTGLIWSSASDRGKLLLLDIKGSDEFEFELRVCDYYVFFSLDSIIYYW